MNIRNTVIIVGAGASAEFGLPTGESVMQTFRNYQRPRIPEKRLGYDNGLLDFHQFLRRAPVKFRQSQDLEELLPHCFNAMSAAAERSIDIFSYRRREFTDIGRMMSTWRIFQQLENAQSTCVQPDISTKQGLVPNWLAVVSDLYCGIRASAQLLSPEKLIFITFNYDRLIERALRRFLRNSFPDIPDEKIPQVLHIHGQFSDLAPNSASSSIAEQAENIRFVLETRDGEWPEVAAAKRALANAAVIYCVGFAFNSLNRDLIELDQYSQRMVALNFDGHDGINAELRRIGLAGDQIVSGTISNPLGVGAAAARGFFERRPPGT